MAQNRKAPAFQEYAAQMLSNKQFKLMSLEERGLLGTMRYECWENKDIPSSIPELAKYLGFTVDDIKTALTDKVRSFFYEVDGSFTCPEMDDYRKHLDDRKAKQSAGGKIGSSITNGQTKSKSKLKDNDLSSTSASNSQISRIGTRESLVKQSTAKQSLEKQSQEQSLESVDTDWREEYEKADSLKNDYQSVRGKR